MLRIGLIGCGAVTEKSHIPALLAASERLKITAAVDKTPERAGLISKITGAQDFNNISAALPHIDAAIVALPHFLHASASIELLEAGKHILVEKPMAINRNECDQMIAASKKSGAILCVGQMRRFAPAVLAAKWLLAGGAVGQVRSWSLLEGMIYDWPVASEAFFRRETAGGGVLMDTGAHTLDMLLWFFGDVEQFEYRDDACGGVEADCEIRMTMKDGSKGYIELSRSRNLPGILEVVGEAGRLLLHFGSNQCQLMPSALGCNLPIVISKDLAATTDLAAYLFSAQLNDWLNAMEKKRAPFVSGEDARRVVDFIERCYVNRQPLVKPWNEAKPQKNI